MKRKAFLLIAITTCLCSAQLTPEQKTTDFTQLAALYAKRYAPYEWKRDTTGYDLYELRPWLDRVRNTRDDFDFYDVCIDYVNSLMDSHAAFALPSSFFVYLGFDVDLYEGKILVDGIARGWLPSEKYQISIGDEVLSIDGVPAQQLLQQFERYSYWRANPRSLRRTAAGMLTAREQFFIPRAHQVGDTAEVVLRGASGREHTLTVPWYKRGLALPGAGPVPGFKMDRQANASRTAAFLPPGEPEYMKPLLAMNVAGVPVRRGDAARGLGDLPPVFDLPEGFHLRLGRNASDNFVTGTYRAGGRNIGYIRIPRMSSTSSLSQALRELELEIAFLEQNTDGLMVDIMRNPGGLLYYGHELARRFIPTPFEGVGFEVRASATYVTEFSNELERARGLGAPDHVVRTWAALLHDVFETYKQNRGRTGTLPLDGHESLSLTPAATVYTKPLVLLVDEYSCSTADLFAAVLQDAGRGPLAGMRTAGCGGSYGNDPFVPATVYSEGKTGVTEAIMVRPKPVVTAEFPTTRYIENVGVRPDVELDIMTRENLLTGGKPFFDAATQVLLGQIGR